MNHEPDNELKRQFAALRDQDSAAVPAFARIVAAPRARAYGPFPLIGALATIAMITAIGVFHRAPGAHAAADVASWRAPSDALLDLAPPAPRVRADFGTAALEKLVPRSLTITGTPQ